MGRLSGRTAAMTGAASGIGRAAARLFASEGASMIIADRAPEVNDTADAIRDAGGKAVALIGDAGDEAFVKSLVDRAVSEFGSLDVFWANAGISGGFTPLHEQTTDYWTEVLRVNLGKASGLVSAACLMLPFIRTGMTEEYADNPKVFGRWQPRMLEPYEAAESVAQLLGRPAEELNLGNFKLRVGGTSEAARLSWSKVQIEVQDETLDWSESAALVRGGA